MILSTNLAPWLIGIGLLLIMVGLLHLVQVFNRWDVHTFRLLYSGLRRSGGFFRHIWPLGTTAVAVTLILIMFIPSWQFGLTAALIFSLMAIIERTIKRKVNRLRPFEAIPGVEMRQPKYPHDPAHPSGDSMRVWLLALIFPLTFRLTGPVLIITIIAAITLSLGRIVLGVHYPLDVIGGAGLGILAAGIIILVYSLVFNITTL
jgi:undecaprenyl-diphosphatase